MSSCLEADFIGPKHAAQTTILHANFITPMTSISLHNSVMTETASYATIGNIVTVYIPYMSFTGAGYTLSASGLPTAAATTNPILIAIEAAGSGAVGGVTTGSGQLVLGSDSSSSAFTYGVAYTIYPQTVFYATS